MRNILALLIAITRILLIKATVNYCGAKMCGHTNAHTFCKYRRGPSPACTGYMEALLTNNEKDRILARLNRRRSEVARGMRQWAPAGDMLKLRWIDELSREAQRWADQCRPPQSPEEHDVCRDLYAISVGQCVASIVGEAPGLRPESMVDMWYMQSLLYDGNVTSYVPLFKEAYGSTRRLMVPSCKFGRQLYLSTETQLELIQGRSGYSGGRYFTVELWKWTKWGVLSISKDVKWPYDKHLYGDFAQMIWSKTYMVGCARSRFMADWRGRLRSVERLVCNFAPRGPITNRPLWIPSEPASVCPPRSRPDSDVPELCAYHNFIYEQNYSKPNSIIEDNYILDTVFEIENNKSLNYLGSLDELYLTKIAIATIHYDVVTVPIYYSLQKRDVFNTDQETDKMRHYNKTEHEHLIRTTLNKEKIEETTATNIKLFRTKVKVIGRPKPYDMNDLNESNEDPEEQKVKNLNQNAELMTSKEKDFYIEYGLVESDQDVENINVSTTLQEIIQETIQTVSNETSVKQAKATIEMSTEISSAIDVMDLLGKIYLNKSSEENNGTHISDKNIEDYLSDPETVRQLQEALDRMERTLESPRPASTSGKVRRELRNLETEIETNEKSSTKSMNLKTDGVLVEEKINKSGDRAPMLRMVLNYLPYLKPYEKEIIGESGNFCSALCFNYNMVTCSLFLSIFV